MIDKKNQPADGKQADNFTIKAMSDCKDNYKDSACSQSAIKTTIHYPSVDIKAVAPPWYYDWVIGFVRPIYRLKLFLTQKKLPHYKQEVAERFGFDYERPKPQNLTKQKVIWCHAVSLGELNTAFALLKCLLDAGYGLYITSTTQTGFQRAATLFAKQIKTKQVVHGFVPIDDKAVLHHFLRCVNPHLVLFVETELWANTLYLLAKYQIATVLMNARLNQRSFLRYQKFAKLSAGMMANLTYALVQDKQSAERFLTLGLKADKYAILDSLKWSVGINQTQVLAQAAAISQAMALDKRRLIWVAGSTHDGEERMLLLAQQKILQQYPTALLVLVPRHPERFDEVVRLCQDSGLVVGRRSSEPLTADKQVYVVDVMGELMAWYALADVTLVAGSFVDIGGHNPVEPAVFAKPIIMGQYVQSCQVLVDELKVVGALCQVLPNAKGDDLGQNASVQIAQAVVHWFNHLDEAKTAGQAGHRLVISKQTAVQKQLSYLLPYL